MCDRSTRPLTPPMRRQRRRVRACLPPQCREPGQVRAVHRLVLIGNASFASNAFFPYASNGDLAVSMIRWLADDTATPLLKPEAYSLPEIRLTHRQMQVTFLLVEVLLPLSVMLFGVVVWWRRR